MDFKQIQELIRIVSKSDLAEVKLEQDNFKITIKISFRKKIQSIT